MVLSTYFLFGVLIIVSIVLQVRQDHQRLNVRCGHALLDPLPGAEHLQHVQAHQPEAHAERHQVPQPDLRRAAQRAAHAHHPLQHGGGAAAGAGRGPGRAHRQLLPVSGAVAVFRTHTHANSRELIQIYTKFTQKLYDNKLRTSFGSTGSPAAWTLWTARTGP
jgi:hypothetical protein